MKKLHIEVRVDSAELVVLEVCKCGSMEVWKCRNVEMLVVDVVRLLESSGKVVPYILRHEYGLYLLTDVRKSPHSWVTGGGLVWDGFPFTQPGTNRIL